MTDTFRILLPAPPADQVHGVVYQITNLVNGKKYIGKTTSSITRRFNEHVWQALRGVTTCRHFYNAIRKYGPDTFAHEVLAVASSEQELSSMEKLFITLHQTTNRAVGYNIGEGGTGGKLSPESAAKRSATVTGRPCPEKRRASMRGKTPWNKGKTLSVEHRAKLSIAKLGNRNRCARRQERVCQPS